MSQNFPKVNLDIYQIILSKEITVKLYKRISNLPNIKVYFAYYIQSVQLFYSPIPLNLLTFQFLLEWTPAYYY